MGQVFLLVRSRDSDRLEEKQGPGKVQAAVRRAHEGLRHPETNRFVRILKASRATPEAIAAARCLKRSVCQLPHQMPKAIIHSAPPRENLQFD